MMYAPPYHKIVAHWKIAAPRLSIFHKKSINFCAFSRIRIIFRFPIAIYRIFNIFPIIIFADNYSSLAVTSDTYLPVSFSSYVYCLYKRILINFQFSQFFVNTKKLIVFCISVRPAGSPCFYLSCTCGYRQVCNKGILRLP